MNEALQKYGNSSLPAKRIAWIEQEMQKDLKQQPKLLELATSLDEYVKKMYSYYELGSLKAINS